MKTNNFLFLLSLIAFSAPSFSQQATITIKNSSERYLKIKLMKGPEKKAVHYKTDSIAPKGAQVFYITETGQYFTKCQAVLINKKDPSKNDTLYSKDKPFLVLSDSKRGYSNFIYEFVVDESKKARGSVAISKKEYSN